MKLKLEYTSIPWGGRISFNNWIIWVDPKWQATKVFDSEGFVISNLIRAKEVWLMSSDEFRSFYLEHEEEIKQEARRLIVKEML